MALVRYGSPIDEVAGSIAGVTFQRTAAGHIARQRAKPIVRRSSRRARTTALLSSYSWAWFTKLNAAQRTAWNAVAATTTWVNTLGQNYSPTGYAAYIRSALVAESASLPGADRAPTALDEADPNVLFDYSAPRSLRVSNWGTLVSPPDGRFIFWRSELMTAGATTFNGPWVFIGASLISTLPGVPWTILNLPVVHPAGAIYFRYTVFRTIDDPAPPPYYYGQLIHGSIIRVAVAANP